MDYQRDVRLAVRDELPDNIDSADVSESLYNQLFHTELVWPVIFYGGYAAFEPDVSLTCSMLPVTDLTTRRFLHFIARHPLPLGEGSSESHVPWRARLA